MINGLSSALQGMQRQSRNFDKAADQVAKAGLTNLDAAAGDPPPGAAAGGTAREAPARAAGGDLLTDGMVNMMLAQRMFTASLRVAQTADEMARDAISAFDSNR